MQDSVLRLNAALKGRYEIERELGQGGMATVYLARDLKHQRRVALKVLKPELAAVVGAERFLAEIRTTANLQHPHILPLHDSGEADGLLFYVMPHVEGESLRARLDREHQLPVDEAARIATNVAEALDYAHRHGVIHRDIKPANILMHDGQPVISDFGIALAVTGGGAGRLTETGLSLGTPHYMSPEQATGDGSVGAATDVWALGCVLYEMLVGEPPYTGGTPQAVLGKIITAEAASATQARKSVPPNVDAAIRKALEKVPADRFRSAEEFARALADRAFCHGGEALTLEAADGGRLWNQLSMATSALAFGLAVALGWALQRSPHSTPPVMRFESPFRAGQEPQFVGAAAFAAFNLSPDGSVFVYRGPAGESANQLWVRRWDDPEAVPLRGTEGGLDPAISPDGQEVAFVQTGEIKVLSLAGGPVRALAEGALATPRWGADGFLYFAMADWTIARVPVTGGPTDPIRPLAEGDVSQRIGAVLPGGELALVQIQGGGLAASYDQVGILDLRRGDVTLVVPGRLPRYAQTGHLTYVAADGSLMAATLDLRRRAVGPPIRVLLNVGGYAHSDNGTLVYALAESTSAITSLVMVARDGTMSPLAELSGVGWFPRFSPDGTRVAYGMGVSGVDLLMGVVCDLWVMDVARAAPTPLTFTEQNSCLYPAWTRDGTRLTHADGLDDTNRVLLTPADGSGGADTLLAIGSRQFPTSWHPDGRTLAMHASSDGLSNTSRHVWMLRLDGAAGPPTPFIETPFNERSAVFSPRDGRWVAYVSDKSGQDEIYARPFPGPGPEVTVSVGGGREPVWAPSGRELFYRRGGDLVVVSIEERALSLVAGSPQRLFPDPYVRNNDAGAVANYDVSPSGDRFVMVEAPSRRVHAVLNWFEELRAHVPD
ncbi:MAG TPA: LpqB family beta-propeller domain-containing protein [Longimicrobiales bacterium]|nr:LpqB family beta-propeller domain-containing protein [Longimicrobiales bacterium]